MSEQTPETSKNQGNEPSMEDILSSIRQMIDADDIGVNVPIQEETAQADSLEPTALVKSVETDAPEPESKTADPLDILESLAAGDSPDDLEIPEISAAEQEDVPIAEITEAPGVSDLDIVPTIEVSPDLALADDEVLILDEVLEFDTEADETSPTDYVAADDVSHDVDLVIEDEDETHLELTRDDDSVDLNIQSEQSVTPAAPSSVTGDTDIDLVKSLMADLTDDDMMGEGDDVEVELNESHLDLVETETELPSSSAFLAIARKASAAAEAVERNRTSQPLNMTPDSSQNVTPIEDELSVQSDSTAIAEADDDLEIWVVEVDDEDETSSDDIAMDAVTENIVKDILETEEQETQGMARVAEETIIDDETEADTSSAFANLAQVVQQQEDGAYMGPHIGELVTEAMKPMIKEWLDKNLKGIVERAVTKEVKRISGGK